MKKIFFILIFTLLISISYNSCNASGEIKYTLLLIENDWDQRDGSNAAIVNSSIVELLVLRTEETLTWLSTRKDISQNLLARLQYDVFTDYSGANKNDLIHLLRSLRSSLLHYSSKDQSTEILRTKLLKKLDFLTIREID